MAEPFLFALWEIACILLAAALFSSPAFRFMDSATASARENRLDGLRYLLAALVVFHHNEYFYFLSQTGRWTISNPTNQFLGKFGVIIFFIISGYLFYDTARGRADWFRFYIKRVFRIFPISLLSAACCVFIAIWLGLRAGASLDFHGILYWFNGGLTNTRPYINGNWQTVVIDAGVTWSLQWEWLLYFSLPLFALFSRGVWRLELVIAILFGCNTLLHASQPEAAFFISLFCLGGICREIRNRAPHIDKTFLDSMLALLLVACVAAGLDADPYAPPMLLLYGAFFACVALGADLFGLFTTRGFRRLGDASYSIYLLHGMVWFITFKTIYRLGWQENPLLSYAVQSAAFAAICLTATLACYWVEKPCIRLGKYWAASLPALATEAHSDRQ